jgi:hypothetical protein
MPQLAQQHQRQLHGKHERDQPSKRRRDMTRQPAGAAGEARRVKTERPGGREQHRPPQRDERHSHQRVRPGARQMRELRDRRQRDKRRSRHDQHRQHNRQQHLKREQPRREQHTNDHQERPEHASGTRQQRSPEQHPDDPLQPIPYKRECEDRVGHRVRASDRLLHKPAVDDKHPRGGRASADRTRRVSRTCQPDHPVSERPNSERHREQRHPEVRHVALQLAYMTPAGRVRECHEMLDRGDRSVLEEPGDQRAGERTEKPVGDRLDDAVKRRQPEKASRDDRPAGRC